MSPTLSKLELFPFKFMRRLDPFEPHLQSLRSTSGKFNRLEFSSDSDRMSSFIVQANKKDDVIISVTYPI